MKNHIIKICFAAALALQACGDEHVFLPGIENAPGETAKLKFVHAASDTVGVNLFLDDLKITGSGPSTITTFGSVNIGKVNLGTITFQNAFPVTNYTSVDRSSGTFNVIFPLSYNATTTFNQKTMSSLQAAALDPDTYYTVAFVGVYPTYETVLYEDDLSQAPIDGKAYVRFANFIHNSTDKLTIRATPPATAEDPNPIPVTLFSAVEYKGMTPFIALPRTGTYTNVQILNASTNAVITTLAAANSNFQNNKVYTVFARGRIGGAVGNAVPGLTRIINR